MDTLPSKSFISEENRVIVESMLTQKLSEISRNIKWKVEMAVSYWDFLFNWQADVDVGGIDYHFRGQSISMDIGMKDLDNEIAMLPHTILDHMLSMVKRDCFYAADYYTRFRDDYEKYKRS